MEAETRYYGDDRPAPDAELPAATPNDAESLEPTAPSNELSPTVASATLAVETSQGYKFDFNITWHEVRNISTGDELVGDCGWENGRTPFDDLYDTFRAATIEVTTRDTSPAGFEMDFPFEMTFENSQEQLGTQAVCPGGNTPVKIALTPGESGTFDLLWLGHKTPDRPTGFATDFWNSANITLPSVGCTTVATKLRVRWRPTGAHFQPSPNPEFVTHDKNIVQVEAVADGPRGAHIPFRVSGRALARRFNRSGRLRYAAQQPLVDVSRGYLAYLDRVSRTVAWLRRSPRRRRDPFGTNAGRGDRLAGCAAGGERPRHVRTRGSSCRVRR